MTRRCLPARRTRILHPVWGAALSCAVGCVALLGTWADSFDDIRIGIMHTVDDALVWIGLPPIARPRRRYPGNDETGQCFHFPLSLFDAQMRLTQRARLG